MKLRDVNSFKQWRKIYQLYRRAFPRCERKPFWLIWRTKRRGQTDVWYLEDEKGFVGFAATVNSKDLVLLDYFAIDNGKRGCGNGSKALQLLQKQYADKRLFLEIESVYEDSDNPEERKRRKQFYLSNGMTEMQVKVQLFGVNMELLGYNCKVDFASYYSVYMDVYGKKISRFIMED